MRVLTRRLEKIKQQRETGRSARAEIPVPPLALVGYTNAGKSTLFRALTGADAYVADQLFATLDPTVRRLRLPGGTPVVLADTVGFIRELPHELVAAFQSTLTEARERARCCCTWSMPATRGATSRSRRSTRCCDEIGAGEIPQLLVYNKIDRLEVGAAARARCATAVPPRCGSAAAARQRTRAAARCDRRAAGAAARSALWLHLPASAGALRSRLYAAQAVREERSLRGRLDRAAGGAAGSRSC